ncbi:MAG: tRNA (pseudouridine(54)-N(1))-methyltransferase TrmY [Thermoplasmata archaeon]|nr:tRNA (pseudouridine(54)-N(1))-methyltransferase TrmY [Thermoplasmata archaeon]
MPKRRFLIVCHDADTDGCFNLDDLPGSGGRIDVAARCVVAGLLISYGVRKDAEILLFFQRGPRPGLTIRISGDRVKYLNPDERSTAALIRNAILKHKNAGVLESSPGVQVFRSDLETLLKTGRNVYYLKEDGIPAENFVFPEDEILFLLGDHRDLTADEESIVMKYARAKLNLSPLSLYSEHCITIIHNILDRKFSGSPVPENRN